MKIKPHILIANLCAICIIVAVLWLICWAGNRSTRDLNAASAIDLLGASALKYWICTGEPPASPAELQACGLLEPTSNPEEFIAWNNIVMKEHVDGMIFAWPDEKSDWRIAGDVVVDEHGREMPPIVIIQGVPDSTMITRAQRRMARFWLAFKQGVPISNRDVDKWLHDCDEIKVAE